MIYPCFFPYKFANLNCILKWNRLAEELDKWAQTIVMAIKKLPLRNFIL